jgi:hypothetical protein
MLHTHSFFIKIFLHTHRKNASLMPYKSTTEVNWVTHKHHEGNGENYIAYIQQVWWSVVPECYLQTADIQYQMFYATHKIKVLETLYSELGRY